MIIIFSEFEWNNSVYHQPRVYRGLSKPSHRGHLLFHNRALHVACLLRHLFCPPAKCKNERIEEMSVLEIKAHFIIPSVIACFMRFCPPNVKLI